MNRARYITVVGLVGYVVAIPLFWVARAHGPISENRLAFMWLFGIAASALGQRLFGVSLHWAWWAWPTVCGACVLLAAVATFLSVRSARQVEPAVVLKGN